MLAKGVLMIKKFFKYVEIMTKITSVFAFLMTLAFLFHEGQPINVKLTLIFFASMFIFDLTTTAINNYIDSKDYPEMLPLPRRAALIIILVMFTISTALGLYLAYCTDIVVLLVGALCFLCGVCYTYGPLPISRLPFGEVCSGVFQGILTPFLLLYINMPEGTFLTYFLSPSEVSLSFKVWPLLTLLLLCMIPTCLTANIMLANNICDVDADVKVNRFTLPYFLGLKHSLTLYAVLYYIAYLTPCIMVVLGMLHPACLLYLLTFPIVQKNIGIFRKEQKKPATFLTAIKNYIVLMTAYSISLLIGGIFVTL